MTNLKHIFFFIPVFISFVSAGQSGNKHAIAIDNSGDTIKGTVMDKNWNRNPTSITLKTPAGEIKEFKPSHIASIKIDSGDYFISAYVPIDMNYVMSLEISEVNIGKTETDSIFLRVLLEAPLSLYLFKDRNGKDHFLVKKTNEPFEELIDKNYQIYYEHKYILRNKSTYRQRLEMMMQDCKSCIEDLPTTDYSEKKLLKLLLKYNQSVNSGNISYIGTVTQSRVQFAVIGGLNITKLQIEGQDNQSHLGEADFPTSYQPTFGIRLILPIARLRDRHAISFDLSWWEYDTKATYSYKHSDIDVHFNMGYIRFTPGYIYKFSNKKLRPYLGIGGSFGFLVSCVNTKHQDDHDPNAPAYYQKEWDGEAYNDPHKFDIGFNAVAGLEYKRLILEFKLESTTGFITTSTLESKVNSNSILLGYRLY